jgi:multimeric flavodoxin WrbA
MVKVSVIYHSRQGHTRRMAEAVLSGVAINENIESRLISVEEFYNNQEFVNESNAIIFGSPTYMGTISSEFKKFMDDTSKIWIKQLWRDKIAAGFTNSGWPSGDKLNTLNQISIFAAQHGMIWVSLGVIPGNLSRVEGEKDLNLLGSFLGAMAVSPFNEKCDKAPPDCDLKTAAYLGKRVVIITEKFKQHNN